MSAPAAVTVLAAGRALLGAALLAAPDAIARRWLGATEEPVRLLVRGMGARDLALGAGALHALARDRDVRPWLAAGVVADATDALANAVAGDRLPAGGRRGTVALAGGAALAGAWLVARS